jgi:hypothetical protein
MNWYGRTALASAWYHGAGPDDSLKPPLFLSSIGGASWYAGEKGGALYEVEVSASNPATEDVLQDAAARLLPRKRFANPFDSIYEPSVRGEIERMGYDSVKGSDPLMSGYIPVLIVWMPRTYRMGPPLPPDQQAALAAEAGDADEDWSPFRESKAS